LTLILYGFFSFYHYKENIFKIPLSCQKTTTTIVKNSRRYQESIDLPMSMQLQLARNQCCQRHTGHQTDQWVYSWMWWSARWCL